MNERDDLWNWISRQSWAYGNLIGQNTTLPAVLGGTGVTSYSVFASTLGISSMAYQASSNVAITGGSISSIAFLSSATISTGTLFATTNVSSATVSTVSIYGTTQVSTALALVNTNISSATISTASLSAGTQISTALARVVTNVSSATVSTASLFAPTQISTALALVNSNVSSASISTASLSAGTQVSTALARVVTNLSSGTISTASVYANTQVSTALALVNTNLSSATISTASIFATDVTASGRVSSASVSTANVYAGTLVSTSTFAIAATSQIANLNASTLQGRSSSYYLATVNHFISVTTITDANSPYTVTATDRYVRCSCAAGGITVLFPHASTFTRELFVKKIDGTTSTITISSLASTDTFDGASTVALASQWATKAYINPVTGRWERLNTPTI